MVRWSSIETDGWVDRWMGPMNGCIIFKARTLDMIEKSSVAKKEDFTPAQDRLHFVLFLESRARDISDCSSRHLDDGQV